MNRRKLLNAVFLRLFGILGVVLASALLNDNISKQNSPEAQASALVQKAVYYGYIGEVDKIATFGTNSVPALLDALRLQNSRARQLYVDFWAALPVCAQKHLPQILPAAKVRANAAAVVGLLGPTARAAIPDLIRLLHDDVADYNAAWSLTMMGPEAEMAVPALITAVEEQRLYAASALGKLGAAAQPAIPALEAAAQNSPGVLRIEAQRALKLIAQR